MARGPAPLRTAIPRAHSVTISVMVRVTQEYKYFAGGGFRLELWSSQRPIPGMTGVLCDGHRVTSDALPRKKRANGKWVPVQCTKRPANKVDGVLTRVDCLVRRELRMSDKQGGASVTA